MPSLEAASRHHAPRTPPRATANSTVSSSLASSRDRKERRTRDPSPAPSDVSSVPDYHIFDSVIALNSYAMDRSTAKIAGSDHLLSKLMNAQEWVRRERQENAMLRIVLQLLRTFSNWARVASLRAERRCRLDAAFSHLSLSFAKHATSAIFDAWAARAVSTRLLFIAAGRAAARIRRMACRGAFEEWARGTAEARLLSKKATRGAAMHSRGLVRRSFTAMCEAVVGRRSGVRVMGLAMCLGRKTYAPVGAANCVKAWQSVAAARGRVRGAVEVMSRGQERRDAKAGVAAAFGGWLVVVRERQGGVRAAQGMCAIRVSMSWDVVDLACRLFFAELKAIAKAGRAGSRAGAACAGRRVRAVVEAWRDWGAWRAHIHRISGRLQRRHAVGRRGMQSQAARVAFSLWYGLAWQMAAARARGEACCARKGRELCRRGLREWRDVSDALARMARLTRAVEIKSDEIRKARAVSGWSMVTSAEKLANASAASVLRRLHDSWTTAPLLSSTWCELPDISNHSGSSAGSPQEDKGPSPKTALEARRFVAASLRAERLLSSEEKGGQQQQQQQQQQQPAEGGSSSKHFAVVSSTESVEGDEARLAQGGRAGEGWSSPAKGPDEMNQCGRGGEESSSLGSAGGGMVVTVNVREEEVLLQEEEVRCGGEGRAGGEEGRAGGGKKKSKKKKNCAASDVPVGGALGTVDTRSARER